MGLQIPPFEYSTDRGYKFLCTFQIIGLKRSEDTIVWVEGGIPPYTWSISGTAFTIDNAITSVQYNTIRAVSNAEVNSTEEITVVDSEGSEVICKAHITDWNEEECCTPSPCSVPGGYVTLSINAIDGDDSIVKGGSYPISVTGGVGPFQWIVTEGTGFSLGDDETEEGSNTLIVAGGICGVGFSPSGKITVSDSCGSLEEREFIVSSNTYYCQKGYQKTTASFTCDSYLGDAYNCTGYSYRVYEGKSIQHYMYRAVINPYPAGGPSYYPCMDWEDDSTSWDTRYCDADARQTYCDRLPPCGSPEACMREKGALINCDTCGDSHQARCIFGFNSVLVRSCLTDPGCT